MLAGKFDHKLALDRLLRPKSIAVIGGREASAVIEQCRTIQYDGEIWPVHPAKSTIHGLTAYRCVDDLPGPPDAAFVAVNRQRTIEIVKSLRDCGGGGAICYASGFTETDTEGDRLQQALMNAAGDMPVIGPNCYGLLNYADGITLWPDQHGGKRLEKDQTGIAIITQSSNIAISITMQQRGLPIAYIITVGNQAQLGLSQIALQVLDDPRVTALGIHIEGFDSISGMEKLAARARQLKKPVIAMKIGRSAQARDAAFTHTASLAGSDAAADAFLKRISIARVNSIPAFLEALKLVHVHGVLSGCNISSMSCSGGEACLMADAVHERKTNFPDLTPDQKKPVEDALGSMVSVANPLDYHTYIWGDGQGMQAAFTGMMRAGFDLNCLVLDYPRTDRCNGDNWDIAIDALYGAKHSTGTKAAIISSMQENLDEKLAEKLIAQGIAPMLGISETLDAIEAAAAIGEGWNQPESLPVVPPTAINSADCLVPDEAEAKQILSVHGIHIPVGKKISCRQGADDNDSLAVAVEEIGFPVVLKSLGIAHKSEMNAVKLDLRDHHAVRMAADELSHTGCELYAEEMVKDSVFELLLGFSTDEQFGLIMTIATGGTLVEVFADSQTLLLPASRSMVEKALRNLKSSVFFDGFRGSPKADFADTVRTILAAQKFALESSRRLVELDINPLIIRHQGQGTVAADALIKFANRQIAPIVRL